MDIQEVILRKQIDFNNEWPKNRSFSSEATQTFENRLIENKIEQLFEPIKLEKDKALEYFMEHKDISKIFSFLSFISITISFWGDKIKYKMPYIYCISPFLICQVNFSGQNL